MGDIRSALEIAMEKVEKMEAATEEERLQWKYRPDGEKLGARYSSEECNLLAELSKYDEKARKYVADGAAGVLIRNIALPKGEQAKKNNKRAMDGIKILKHDKVAVENIFSQIRRLFDHYLGQGEQQRRQAYQALRAEVEAKLQKAVQQQYGGLMGKKIDIERQPMFQEEWRRVLGQLDSQYNQLLAEYKRELEATS